MRPSPTSPSVLPRTSAPDDDFSQRPSRIAASNFGSWRTSASSSANVCSATLTELPPGVLITSTPRLVASSRSMLSTPTPARPTARNFFAQSSNSAVTLVALRTIKASASAISAFNESFAVITTFQPGCSFNNCTPRSLILSATMTFIYPFLISIPTGRTHQKEINESHRSGQDQQGINESHRSGQDQRSGRAIVEGAAGLERGDDFHLSLSDLDSNRPDASKSEILCYRR